MFILNAYSLYAVSMYTQSFVPFELSHTQCLILLLHQIIESYCLPIYVEEGNIFDIHMYTGAYSGFRSGGCEAIFFRSPPLIFALRRGGVAKIAQGGEKTA